MKLLLSALCLLVSISGISQSANTQQKEQLSDPPKGAFGGDIYYILSTDRSTSSGNGILFQGNGIGAALNYKRMFGSGLGIIGSVGYEQGNTATDNLNMYAESLVQQPLTYRLEQQQKTWQQWRFMIGPSMQLGKGLYAPVLELQAGVAFRKVPGYIIIRKWDASTYISTVYEKSYSANALAWRLAGCIPVKRTKGRPPVISLLAGYGAGGGTIGIRMNPFTPKPGGESKKKHDYVGHVTLVGKPGPGEGAFSPQPPSGTTNPPLSTPTNTGTHRIIWGKSGHRCHDAGLYCYIKPYIPKKYYEEYIKELGDDETMQDPVIELKNNRIVIVYATKAGTISKGTLEQFISGSIKPVEQEFPANYFNDLFQKINLNSPAGPIQFKPEDQQIWIRKNMYEGESGSIVELFQKTTIEIKGKVYELIILTTSSPTHYVGHVTLLR